VSDHVNDSQRNNREQLAAAETPWTSSRADLH
jgi:hypothetical protein